MAEENAKKENAIENKAEKTKRTYRRNYAKKTNGESKKNQEIKKANGEKKKNQETKKVSGELKKNSRTRKSNIEAKKNLETRRAASGEENSMLETKKTRRETKKSLEGKNTDNRRKKQTSEEKSLVKVENRSISHRHEFKFKKPTIKIIPLGGIEEIGKNITVFEYEDDIIVVDCGLEFPTDDMLGIDLVIPDVTYLVKNKEKVRGIFITHGHEDHIGSIPYVLRQINDVLQVLI